MGLGGKVVKKRRTKGLRRAWEREEEETKFWKRRAETSNDSGRELGDGACNKGKRGGAGAVSTPRHLYMKNRMDKEGMEAERWLRCMRRKLHVLAVLGCVISMYTVVLCHLCLQADPNAKDS